VQAIAAASQPPPDPLAHWEQLERAADKGWALSTNEVAQLIGTRPRGQQFQRGSFTFIRAGKIGRQAAWRVSKAD